jgi:hypothetical protein
MRAAAGAVVSAVSIMNVGTSDIAKYNVGDQVPDMGGHAVAYVLEIQAVTPGATSGPGILRVGSKPPTGVEDEKVVTPVRATGGEIYSTQAKKAPDAKKNATAVEPIMATTNKRSDLGKKDGILDMSTITDKLPSEAGSQKRYFEISGSSLKYYKDYKKGSLLAAIDLGKIEIELNGMVLQVHLSAAKVMHLRAESAEDAEAWAKAIESARQVAEYKKVGKVEAGGCEGYLEKDGRNGTWQKRYFEVAGKNLKYYKDAQKNPLLASIDLGKIDLLLEGLVIRLVLSATKMMQLRANSEEDAQEWMQVLERAKRLENEPNKKENSSARAFKERVKKENEERMQKREESSRRREAEAKAKEEAEEQARQAAEEQARQEAEEKAKKEAKKESEKQAVELAKKAAEEQARQEAEEQARQEAEQKVKQDVEEQAKKAAEEQAKKEAEQQAKKEAEQQAKEQAEKEAEQQAKEEAKREAEEQAEKKAEEQAKKKAEEQGRKKEAEDQARKEAEEQEMAEMAERIRKEAYEQGKREAEEKVRIAAEEQARKETEALVKKEAEGKARNAAKERAAKEAEEQARLEAEEKTRSELEEQAREELAKKEAEERALRDTEEQEEQVHKEAEEKAKREAEKELSLKEMEVKIRQEAYELGKKEAEERAKKERGERAKEMTSMVAKMEAKKDLEAATRKQTEEQVIEEMKEMARQAEKAGGYEGYLEKDGRNGAWQKRYFEVVGQNLKYYKDYKKASLLAAIDLGKIEIELDGMVLRVKLSASKAMQLRAESAEDTQKWMEVIDRARKLGDQPINNSSARAFKARMKKETEERLKTQQDSKRRRAAVEKTRREAAEQARREMEEQARQEKVDKARKEVEEAQRIRERAERIKLVAYEEGKREAEEQARKEAAEAVERAKIIVEEKAKLQAARARKYAEEKAKREAEEKAAKEAEEEQARREEAEIEAKKEAEREAKEAEKLARKLERDAFMRKAQEQAKQEAEEQARSEEEARAKQVAEEEAWMRAQESKRKDKEEEIYDRKLFLEIAKKAKEDKEQARLDAIRQAAERKAAKEAALKAALVSTAASAVACFAAGAADQMARREAIKRASASAASAAAAAEMLACNYGADWFVGLLQLASECSKECQLLFTKPFDKNGVLHWLGTGGKQKMDYSNPHSNGQVVAKMSSVYRGDPKNLVEHYQGAAAAGSASATAFGTMTENVKKSWVSVDLGEGRGLKVRHYCLRHGVDDASGRLRNWKLQGSNDGSRWCTLKTHAKDKSLSECGWAEAAWAIDGVTEMYRHFRILQNGMNSDCINILCCAGVEFYGEFRDESKGLSGSKLTEIAAEITAPKPVRSPSSPPALPPPRFDPETGEPLRESATAELIESVTDGMQPSGPRFDPETGESIVAPSSPVPLPTASVARFDPETGELIETTRPTFCAENESLDSHLLSLLMAEEELLMAEEELTQDSVSRIRTSNIGKYLVGQAFNNGTLSGFIVSIEPDTPGAQSGPGVLSVGASQPLFDPETGKPLGAPADDNSMPLAPKFDPETGEAIEQCTELVGASYRADWLARKAKAGVGAGAI